MPLDTKAAILSKNPCTIFEYTINKDIQGKVEEKNGIFFKIPKIEIICFNTGICFLCIKTNIEESDKFSDLLNFNYKFRDINQEFFNMNSYDNIRVQTDCFEDVKYFKEFIESLTGPTTESMKLDIDTERFLAFSYACIDQENWNNSNEFDRIRNNYIKYLNILPNDNNVNYEKEEMKVIGNFVKKYLHILIVLFVAILCAVFAEGIYADICNNILKKKRHEAAGAVSKRDKRI